LASQLYWQLGFGAVFLAMVLIWLWFAFVRPPVFGKYNAFNFTYALYEYLLQGVDQDLPIIAAELRRSARALVKQVNELPQRRVSATQQESVRRPTASDYASDVLLLIGNRKFCRHIMASSPDTAIAFFRAMSEFHKYRIPISQFASNLSTEALLNRDSILYHEDEGYRSGFFGYLRQFTTTVYGDFHLVEALAEEGRSPLDIDLDFLWGFDAKQLEAYTRAVLTTFRSALDEQEFHIHSYALYRAFSRIQLATLDLYKLDDEPRGSKAEDIQSHLRVVVRFINDAIDLLDRHGVQRTVYRRHDEQSQWNKDYYDYLADMMFEVIFNASAVKKGDVNWSIQFVAIWVQFFGLQSSRTRKILLFKLRRLLYDEVLRLEFPNFKSATILGYLLNVMGVKVGPKSNNRAAYPLKKVVISWARRNYLWLVERQPKVAEAVLMGTISFDKQHSQLVKTYKEGLDLVAPTDTLDLDQPTDPIQS
jgi:hypothetical protein